MLRGGLKMISYAYRIYLETDRIETYIVYHDSCFCYLSLHEICVGSLDSVRSVVLGAKCCEQRQPSVNATHAESPASLSSIRSILPKQKRRMGKEKKANIPGCKLIILTPLSSNVTKNPSPNTCIKPAQTTKSGGPSLNTNAAKSSS